MSGAADAGPRVRVLAPAKLTLSLHVRDVRPDGFHDLEAEMVCVDLADELVIAPGGRVLVIDYEAPARLHELSEGPDNLVRQALAAAGRRAAVHLTKRIPVEGGLGGGSADAAAVLRWAGVDDPAVAVGLGADVPFCVIGGRALVGGIGEQVRPLPYEDRVFVLLVPPFGVDTAAVYAAWDLLSIGRRSAHHEARNDLTEAACTVEPRLGRWRDLFAEVTGAEPVLAGSGSTWFAEGDREFLGLGDRSTLVLGDQQAALVEVRTVPPGWGGPIDP